jgi:hypothetical protein
MYLFMKRHHEEFMKEEKLRQLFHGYDTNNVEGFNKFLTKFLPKDRTYCQTIENKARSMLAVCLQSIGYRKTYERRGSDGVLEENEDESQKGSGQKPACKHCGSSSHSRRTSLQCPMNHKNKVSPGGGPVGTY